MQRGHPSRKIGGLCVLALAAGGLLAVGVAAHTTHYPSSVEINAQTNINTGDYVYGVVTSPNSHCAAHRRVGVFRRRPGHDAKLGSDVSQHSPNGGPYTVTAPTGDLPPGPYYAHAKKRDLRPGPRHAHICRGATSDDLVVGP